MTERIQPDALKCLEIPQSPEEIFNGARWEDFTFAQYPLAGAITHWGFDVDNEKIAEILTCSGSPTNKDQVDKTGFNQRSLYPFGTSLADAAVVEKMLGVELIQRACANYGIKPEQLSVVAFANSFPFYRGAHIQSFTKQIASLGRVPSEALTIDAQLLCNGTVELMRKLALQSDKLNRKFVAVGSVEGLSKMLVPNEVGKRVDPANLQIFTNAGAALVWQMGKDIEFPQIGEFQSGHDDYKTAIGDSFYDFPDYINPGDIYADEACIRQRIIPTPDGATYASMDPRATLQWVGKVVKPRFLGVLRKHFPHPHVEEIPYIGHVPSEIVHTNLITTAQRNGYNLHAPIYVRDGNASSAVALMQMLRASADGFFDNDLETLVFGYGLGWNMSSFTMRMLRRKNF